MNCLRAKSEEDKPLDGLLAYLVRRTQGDDWGPHPNSPNMREYRAWRDELAKLLAERERAKPKPKEPV